MTDPWLTFNAVVDPVVLSGILALAAIFFIGLEWKRKAPYLILRICAITLMLLSILALAMRPMVRTKKINSTILLTPEYNASQLDSLLKRYPGIKVLHTTEATASKNSAVVHSSHQLSDPHENIQFVLGQGLSASALDVLGTRSFNFLPAPYPWGIISLSVEQPVLSKRRNKIEGILNNNVAGIKLYLEGPGGKEDSVTLPVVGY